MLGSGEVRLLRRVLARIGKEGRCVEWLARLATDGKQWRGWAVRVSSVRIWFDVAGRAMVRLARCVGVR